MRGGRAANPVLRIGRQARTRGLTEKRQPNYDARRGASGASSPASCRDARIAANPRPASRHAARAARRAGHRRHGRRDGHRPPRRQARRVPDREEHGPAGRPSRSTMSRHMPTSSANTRRSPAWPAQGLRESRALHLSFVQAGRRPRLRQRPQGPRGQGRPADPGRRLPRGRLPAQPGRRSCPPPTLATPAVEGRLRHGRATVARPSARRRTTVPQRRPGLARRVPDPERPPPRLADVHRAAGLPPRRRRRHRQVAVPAQHVQSDNGQACQNYPGAPKGGQQKTSTSPDRAGCRTTRRGWRATSHTSTWT